jgi:TolB-like protein
MWYFRHGLAEDVSTGLVEARWLAVLDRHPSADLAHQVRDPLDDVMS